MDCRVIGERSEAVLRTTMPGNEGVLLRISLALNPGYGWRGGHPRGP
jgi:hypothetical protein